jgi:hypothetical protein
MSGSIVLMPFYKIYGPLLDAEAAQLLTGELEQASKFSGARSLVDRVPDL